MSNKKYPNGGFLTMPRRPEFYQLSSAGKSLFFLLCGMSNNERKCWPGVRKIASEIDVTQPTVIEQIKQLEQAGLIKVDRLPNQNVYEILCSSEGASGKARLPTSDCQILKSHSLSAKAGLSETRRTKFKEREALPHPIFSSNREAAEDICMMFEDFNDGHYQTPSHLNAIEQLIKINGYDCVRDVARYAIDPEEAWAALRLKDYIQYLDQQARENGHLPLRGLMKVEYNQKIQEEHGRLYAQVDSPGEPFATSPIKLSDNWGHVVEAMHRDDVLPGSLQARTHFKRSGMKRWRHENEK